MAALYAYHSIAYLWMAILGFSSPVNVISVSCPTGDLTYSTDPFSCTATIEFPFPDVVSDQVCGAWEIHTEVFLLQDSIVLDTNGQVVETLVDTAYFDEVGWDAPTRVLSGIPIGCHLIRYTVSFECEDVMEYCSFCVEDQIAPSAICDGGRNVYLTSQGSGQLPAVNFNAGSNDYCGLDGLQIRRHQYDTLENNCGLEVSPWGDFIEIFCCDVGDTIEVDLMVTDLAGNASICYSEIYVLDGAQPICQPPGPVSIACNELPAGFSPLDSMVLQNLFGVPAVIDNCGGYITEVEPIINLDACGIGQIIRRFVPIDDTGLTGDTCGQSVMITPSHDVEIRFPKDDRFYVEVDELEMAEFYNYGCDSVVLADYEDEFFPSSGEEECFKIFRTIRVEFPCEGQSDEDQVLNRDEDCDGNPGDEDLWALIRNDSIYLDRDSDEENLDPFVTENNCHGIKGYWRAIGNDLSQPLRYIQVHRVFDTIPPVVNVLSSNAICADTDGSCETVDTITFQAIDSCYNQFNYSGEIDRPEVSVFVDYEADGVIDEELTTGLSLQSGGIYAFTHTFPQGQHILEIHATDFCGNSTVEEFDLEIGVDCTPPPIPNCIAGRAVEFIHFDIDGDSVPDEYGVYLSPTEFLTELVVDDDPCNTGEITYSINLFDEEPDIEADSIFFDCSDVGLFGNGSTKVLDINAWDEAGNRSTCNTYVLLMHSYCEGLYPPYIYGMITTEINEIVEGVFVELTGQSNQSHISDEDGYWFSALTAGYDYNVTPFYDEGILNGVSTFDIVLIAQHILGIDPLDSPYKRIAADVNDSGSITTLDLIAIRKLILGVETEFPNGVPSWRFVPAAYNFPYPSNPWEEYVPDQIYINNISTNINDADFIAVKMGDVNLDADTMLE